MWLVLRPDMAASTKLSRTLTLFSLCPGLLLLLSVSCILWSRSRLPELLWAHQVERRGQLHHPACLLHLRAAAKVGDVTTWATMAHNLLHQLCSWPNVLQTYLKKIASTIHQYQSEKISDDREEIVNKKGQVSFLVWHYFYLFVWFYFSSSHCCVNIVTQGY